MEQTLDFYRRLGLTIKDPMEWPPGSGARHTSVSMANGFGLEFDNIAGARTWNPGLDEAPTPGGRSVIGFALPSSTEVDRLHAELTSAGYRSRLAPHDAFWGGALRDRARSRPQPGGPDGPDRPAAGLYADGLTPAAQDGGGRPLHGRHDLVGRAIAAGEHVKAFKAAQDKQEIHQVVDRLAFGWCRDP